MKIRNNYVSNSSSASFIVLDWFDLQEEKRKYIKNYDQNALKLWRKENLEYQISEDGSGYEANYPFYGEEYNLIYNEQNNRFDFGWLNNCCRYFFVEDAENNICIINTMMTNFDMEKWLQFNEVKFSKEEQ